MKKNIIKSIVFIFIFCAILFIITKILWLPPNAISYFYKEKENSLDVVYVGSSNVLAHFNTTLAYNLYGYTTGILSSNAQPFALIKYLLKEAEKYQNPNLYIVDITKITDDIDYFSTENIRECVDSMKFSRNRIEAINEALSYRKDVSKNEYINYYFSFLMYHNRWKYNPKTNIVGNKNFYKGYWFTKETCEVVPQNTYTWKKDLVPLQEDNKKILISLINYINQNNLKVLFVVPIRCYDEERNGRLNDAIRILQENELNVINFNTLNDFDDIDFSRDLYNEAHLNVYGATKYTLYFAKYLKENYELEDHRNDENYSSWNKEYERFKENFKKMVNKNYEELLQK